MRKIYSDKQSSFKTLLEKHGSVSIHNQNLQILATEMYKIKIDLSPLVITNLFEQRDKQHCDLKNNVQFTIHWSESISFLGPKIWNIISYRLKNGNRTEAFKMQMKIWNPELSMSALRGLCSKYRFCLRHFLY